MKSILHSGFGGEGLSLRGALHEPGTFEPLRAHRPRLPQVVTNRISQFIAANLTAARNNNLIAAQHENLIIVQHDNLMAVEKAGQTP